MARRRKAQPPQRDSNSIGEDRSLLLRSAESLGRVIGALQRQLDDATRRLSRSAAGTDVRRPASNGAEARKSRAVKKKRTPQKKKAAATPLARRTGGRTRAGAVKRTQHR